MEIEGLPVIDVDESEEITVAVSADDLREGDTSDPDQHPVAIALRRQKGVDDARVTESETLVRRGKKWFRYDAPDKADSKNCRRRWRTAELFFLSPVCHCAPLFGEPPPGSHQRRRGSSFRFLLAFLGLLPPMFCLRRLHCTRNAGRVR